MAYPRKLLTDGETVVEEFRPHWRMLVIPVGWTVLYAAVVWATWNYAPDESIFDWIVTAVATGFWFRLGLYPLIAWWFTWYILTNERLITRRGVLARKGLEIPLENINDVRFEQSILERVLRSGDLVIESAGEQGQSKFSDIPEPERFQSTVYRVREVRSRDLASGRGVEQSDPTSQLERLGRLHKEGLLSSEEFEAKKKRLLDEI